MSLRQRFLLIIALSLLQLSALFTIVHYSKTTGKTAVLGKASGLFNLWTETVTGENSTLLRLTVSPKQDIPEAQIAWHLLPGTFIFHGEPTMPTGPMHRGESRTFEIEVRADEFATPQAHAEISNFQNGIKLGATAAFTRMRPENRSVLFKIKSKLFQ